MTLVKHKIGDRVRLEVDASDVSNQIVNHSGQTGTTLGWTVTSPAGVAALTAPDGLLLRGRGSIANGTNLLTANPSFETTSLTHLTALGGATLTRDGTWAAAGAWSLKITPAASAASGARMVLPTLTVGNVYTFSAVARLANNRSAAEEVYANARQIRVILQASTDGVTFTDHSTLPGGAVGPWMLANTVTQGLLSCTFSRPATPAGSVASRVVVDLMNGANTATRPIWFDDLALYDNGPKVNEYAAGLYSPGNNHALALNPAVVTPEAPGVITSPAVPVAPGQFSALRFSWTTNLPPEQANGGYLVVRVTPLFYDAASTQIGTGATRPSGAAETGTTGWTAIENTTFSDSPLQVPPLAATMKWRISFEWADASGYAHGLSQGPSSIYLARAMAVVAATSAAAVGVGFNEAVTWQDLLSNSLSVDIHRGGDVDGVTDAIEVGLMTARLRDPTADPTQNPRIRRGRKIRVMANHNPSDDLQSAPGWRPIFTGTISGVAVAYGDSKFDQTAPPLVTLSATDAIADLTNVAAPFNFSGAFGEKVNALMAAAVTPYVTDTGVGSTTKTSRNDSATLWDQLLLARNSAVNAKVYVRADGVVVAKVQAATATVDGTFSGGAGAVSFTDIDLDYSSRALVNQLLIDRTNTDEPDETKTYGPFNNAASIADWGIASAQVDVIDGVPSTLAADYLSKYSVASIFPNSLTFNAMETGAFDNAFALYDLYQQPRIIYAPAGLDKTVYIIGVQHTIRPDEWTVTLTFRPLDATVAGVVVINGSGATNAGPADLLPGKGSAVGDRCAMERLDNHLLGNSGAWQVLTGFTELYDDGGIQNHSTGIITVPETDIYAISGGMIFSNTNATGRRILQIETVAGAVGSNGLVRNELLANGFPTGLLYREIRLNAGTQLQMTVYQTSGVNTMTGRGGDMPTHFACRRIGNVAEI